MNRFSFGDELDLSWLGPELKREDSFDALEALRQLAESDVPVTDQMLRDLVDDLNRRG